MILKYRKATLNDIEEICGIVHNAIDNMERKNIFQWDDLYPTKEDFQEDVDKNQLYVGMMNGQIAVVYTLNQECDEQYFFTSEVINGSGEYVKIAAVPKSYEVSIVGTGTGKMDVSVSEYTSGQLGDTKQYYDVPIAQGSEGVLKNHNSGIQHISLVVDGVTYTETDYIQTPKPQKVYIWILLSGVIIASGMLLFWILKPKKKGRYQR